MPFYTYDPAKYSENGSDRMRLELGDTDVSGEADTAALSDEEYAALISAYSPDGSGWYEAQYRCLEAIYMRMAFEVDSKIGPASWSFSDRAARWQQMYKDRKAARTMPAVSPRVEAGLEHGHSYFRNGMQGNPRALTDTDVAGPRRW